MDVELLLAWLPALFLWREELEYAGIAGHDAARGAIRFLMAIVAMVLQHIFLHFPSSID